MNCVEEAPHLEYYRHLLNLDRRAAEAVLQRMLDEHGGDVVAVYDAVLVPALIHAGEEWQADRISVAHEHYISEATRAFLFRFGSRMLDGVEAGANAAVAVTCAAPSERHVLGLIMVGDVLRAAGLEVHSLGEGAPASHVARFVEQVQADLLAVSVSLPDHLAEAEELVAHCKRNRPQLTVLFGGNAFRGPKTDVSSVGSDHILTSLSRLRTLLPEITRTRNEPA